jgi:hypothetical protein
MLLRLSPSLQLLIVSAGGAVAAAVTDSLVNGRSSGVAKAADLIGSITPMGIFAIAAAWFVFAMAGIASCAWFRPLTRQSACFLAFGSAAVLAMLIPGR